MNSSPYYWMNPGASRGTAGQCLNTADLLKQVLQNKIKINPDEEKACVAIVNVFLESLVIEMGRVDPLFNELFQKIYYTGSYYDGLRISNANEFDINLVLKLPFSTNRGTMEHCTVASFAKYKLKYAYWPGEKRELCDHVRGKFFANNYLISSSVKEWMQSILDRVTQQQRMPKPSGVLWVTPSAGGPAKTLSLYLSSSYKIDIDLVPVIEYHEWEWPVGARENIVRRFPVPQHNQFLFLVPKEYSGREALSPFEKQCCWRMHFPEIEKKILLDREFAKPIIKLLKLIRDKENWSSLASYYLKTVVMWMVKDHPEDSYWSESNAWACLMEALEILKTCMERKRIPYIIYPVYNLIENINDSEADNIRDRLARIIRSLEQNYSNIEYYI